MNEIARLLRQEGLDPQPAFLADCGLQIGLQVDIAPYRLIYRVDAGHLILCSFYRTPDSGPQFSSLIRFWRLLRRLFQRVSSLNGVRMLVITNVLDQRLALQRQQLVRLLHRLGAVGVMKDGDDWLEIPASRLLHRRKSPGSSQ
ncbi:secreted effector protein [Lonsdalea quercina]|uniref:secreted effector protein n=1 Tax=Lonsdalea quercina TaxID=71657 RepID=UPI003975E922